MLTNQQIRAHYKTPEIMETIIRCSTFEDGTRAGMKNTPNAYTDKEGNLRDSTDWYNNKFGARKKELKINLSKSKDYINAVTECRTLYWTLNIFNKEIFDIDFKKVEHSERTMLSKAHTVGYMLGIDIDKEHGKDIHDPEVKKAVEDMAQHFSNALREYIPNSVYVLYSGGGIYVLIHHEVSRPYFEMARKQDEFDTLVYVLQEGFNDVIKTFETAFFENHPEHKGKVKADALNNAQRVFKTIFSIHKKLDYAVIPLDPETIKIDFEDATIPLKQEVIDTGKDWYSKFDDGASFLNSMKPYFEAQYNKKKKYANVKQNDIPCSKTAIEFDKWAPCMKNIYSMPECGEGATRALAIFASFLGQIGYTEDKAHGLFSELADRWGARTANLFESYYGKMCVPSCERLTSNDNTGFPRGVSIRQLNVCKPCVMCANVPSPRYYTDTEANKQRLLKRLEKGRTAQF